MSRHRELGLTDAEYELICEKLLANPLIEDYDVIYDRAGTNGAGA